MPDEQRRLRELALDSTSKQFERELIRNFQTALKEIRGKVALAYEKSDGSFADMQRYKRLDKLETEIAAEVGKLTGKNAQTLKRSQKNVYEESYYRTAFILSNAVQADLGFAMLDNKLIEEAIANPLDRVGFLKRNRDNQARLTRQLREQLTQGLIQGEAFGTTAKRLKERMDIGASNAVRIVQTENHRVIEKSKLDAMEEGAKRGITLKKEWMATIDGDTRDRHGKLDGKRVDINADFEVDGYKAQAPGLFGEASMDINCRCTMIEIVDGFEPNQRRVRDVGITNYKTYNEFKEKGLVKKG